ncbi:MAG: NrdH-redoxin [Actinomycetota bacterium]|nr:NrdH-redoxin [Actinomycetota bacterium]
MSDPVSLDSVGPKAVGPESVGPEAVVVYWRSGCGFCMRLIRSLELAGARTKLRNIWEDDDARQFVGAHNHGNETVPTVAVGGRVVTNPEPGEFVAWLADAHPALMDAPADSGR